MRPILMLDNLRDLQDARYCAAVGVSLLGFKLEGADAIEGKAVKEMVEWLSGPQAYLRYSDASPSLINEQASTCLASGVQLPSGYDLAQAAQIELPILWRLEADCNAERFQEIVQQFPDALYLMGNSQGGLLRIALDMGIGGQVILSCDDPDAIWRSLQAEGHQLKGFLLGQFASDEEGLLDYDACDAFIERFEALLPA